MEKYKDFLKRINSFEKPELAIKKREFTPNHQINSKVGVENQFNPFFGDTVVFELDDENRERIYQVIEHLYSFIPECFSEKLKKESLHMTLHDLSNSTSLNLIKSEVKANQEKLKSIQTLFLNQLIRMKTNFIVDMCNTSLVIALYPAEENEYIKLYQLYSLIDKVKMLPYPFTPHITLGYYNQHGFEKEHIQKLSQFVHEWNSLNGFTIVLDTHNLYYERFTSMNNYEKVFRIVE